MKSDDEIKQKVQEAIKNVLLSKNDEISIMAKDGIITLTGTVDDYLKKIQVTDVVIKVTGVRNVIDNIEIQYGDMSNLNDTVLSKVIINVLNWNLDIPVNKIRVDVNNGLVTLTGEVQSNTQKEAAEKSICNLAGVKGVTNNIAIASENHRKIKPREANVPLPIQVTQLNHESKVEKSNYKELAFSYNVQNKVEKISWQAPHVLAFNNVSVLDYNMQYFRNRKKT